MTTSVTAPAPIASPSLALAGRVAALLPARAGRPWTVEPYRAWWTVKPAARLVHGDRALVLVAHTWRTDIAWQLPDREPVKPDYTLERMAAEPIAREVLRLVLPVVDDEAARTCTDGSLARQELLYEVARAMRAQGAATYERAGLLANTASVVWAANRVRYSATLHGTNPVCDVQIQGLLRDVERAVARFLPAAAPLGRPVVPSGIRGRLERRIAQVLARHGHVEQLDGKGLAFGTGPGPYGYVAASPDPAAKAHETTAASVDVHAVGVDFLVSLAPQLAR